MNQIQIIGMIGQDAKTQTYSNKDLVQFSVAVNDDFKNPQGEWEKRTIWYDCTQWNTNNITRFPKGTMVFVQGVPRLNMYTKADGTTAASIKITVSKADVLRKGEATNAAQPSAPAPTPTAAPAATFDTMPSQEIADDLPF